MSWAQETVRIAIGTGDKNSELAYREIVGEAYRRAGFNPVFLIAPHYDSEILVVQGMADASAVSVDELAARDCCIKIPTIIGAVPVTAISLKSREPLVSEQALQKRRVGTLRYYRFMQETLPFQPMQTFETLHALARKLKSGQLEYVLHFPQSFGKFTKRHYPDLELQFKPLKKLNLFHYVGKDQKALVQPLNKEFLSMHKDGYILKTMRSFGYKVDGSFLTP